MASHDADVLVIGAGMAGLTAAVMLRERGLRVLVIEARDRIGGRVHTVRESLGPLPIELGAEFVHGDAPRTTRLAAEAPAALVDVPGSHWRRRRGRLEEDKSFKQTLTAALERAGTALRGGADRSFAQAMRDARVREPARTLALHYIEGFQASDPERISARALAGEDLGTERIRRALPGLDGLAQLLRDRLPQDALLTGKVARLVRWKRSEVEVSGRLGPNSRSWTLRASHAVISVPLGILQSNHGEPPLLAFEPELEQKQRALARLAMGHVAKITFRFREAFWESNSVVRAAKGQDLACLGFMHEPGLAMPTWWTFRPLHMPLLTGWAGGPRAQRLLDLGESQRIDAALDSLAKALGIAPRIPRNELVGLRWHDWASDPFARGAYSYPLVGGARAARELGRPVERTLFFAGEATSPPPSNGTVEGAIESGERAARELLASARRSKRKDTEP
jgi:monoamine oxidase